MVVNNASDALSGTSTNTTALGLASFSALRLRAAPGPYNLTATGLPSSATDASDYEPARVVVTVRRRRRDAGVVDTSPVQKGK